MSKRMIIYWIIVVIFKYAVFGSLFVSLCDCFWGFCMTANRTVNAIILVQTGFC